MVYRLEVEPELAPHEMVPSKLIDFLALRLLLTLAAVDSLLPGSGVWRRAAVNKGRFVRPKAGQRGDIV